MWNLGLLGAAAGGAFNYYIALIDQEKSRIDDINVINSQEIFLSGRNNADSSGDKSSLIKIDGSANILFETAIQRSVEIPTVVHQHTSGDIYVGGIAFGGAGGVGIMDFTIYKLDSSGNIVWQRGGGKPNDYTQIHSMGEHNNDLIFMLNSEASSGNNGQPTVYKYDVNGNQIAKQQYQQNTYSPSYEGVVAPDVDEVVLAGWNDSGGQVQPTFAYFDKAFNLIRWQKYNMDSNRHEAKGIIRHAGKYYVVGKQVNGGAKMEIYNVNSNNEADWYYQLSFNGLAMELSRLAVDSQGYLYAVGYFEDNSKNDSIIFKYTTNGDIVWQRTLSSAGGDVRLLKIDIDENDDIYVAGVEKASTNGVNDKPIFMKLPNDGSGTGTVTVGSTDYVYGFGAFNRSGNLSGNLGYGTFGSGNQPYETLFTQASTQIALNPQLTLGEVS